MYLGTRDCNALKNMQISYEIRLEDYLAANRLWFKKNKGPKKWIGLFVSSRKSIFIGIACILAGVVLAFANQHLPPSLPYFVGGLIGAGIVMPLYHFLYLRNMKWRYRQQKLETAIEIETGQSGVNIRRKNGDTEGHYKWAAFERWVEADHHFVLFPDGILFIVIPKRAMNPEQQVELRGILTENVRPVPAK